MPTTPLPLTILLGKAVKQAAKLRGGGSALPGLFVETIDKGFLAGCLAQLPHGVVLISGTNGKTTTTKMVVELLEGQGLRVFTNRTGSNFTRGVVAALLSEVDARGTLHADIAVLELDEAHAVQFVKSVRPRHSLLLNVMRDQLDRFGEIDATAKLLRTVAAHTTEKITINREDPRLLSVAASLPTDKVSYFGLDASLRSSFPNDDDMRGGQSTHSARLPKALCVLEEVDDHTAVFSVNDKKMTVTLQLEGIYNIFNAAAAVALLTNILGETVDREKLSTALAAVTPAFGRGEKLMVNGRPLELVLVKNPGGFRLSLKSFDPAGYATMIAINDNYADGRDMSWLWDVEFDSLAPGISHISGVRAYDMALRMQYEDVEVSVVEPNIQKALKGFIKDNPSTPKRIYCTYTAMLTLRRELSKITKVEVVS